MHPHPHMPYPSCKPTNGRHSCRGNDWVVGSGLIALCVFNITPKHSLSSASMSFSVLWKVRGLLVYSKTTPECCIRRSRFCTVPSRLCWCKHDQLGQVHWCWVINCTACIGFVSCIQQSNIASDSTPHQLAMEALARCQILTQWVLKTISQIFSSFQISTELTIQLFL